MAGDIGGDIGGGSGGGGGGGGSLQQLLPGGEAALAGPLDWAPSPMTIRRLGRPAPNSPPGLLVPPEAAALPMGLPGGPGSAAAAEGYARNRCWHVIDMLFRAAVLAGTGLVVFYSVR